MEIMIKGYFFALAGNSIAAARKFIEDLDLSRQIRAAASPNTSNINSYLFFLILKKSKPRYAFLG